MPITTNNIQELAFSISTAFKASRDRKSGDALSEKQIKESDIEIDLLSADIADAITSYIASNVTVKINPGISVITKTIPTAEVGITSNFGTS